MRLPSPEAGFGSGCPTDEQAQSWPTPVPPAIREWMAHHRANLVRLSLVKARRDPDGVFTYPKGIAPHRSGQPA